MHVSEMELKEFIVDCGLVAKKEVDAAEKEAVEKNQSIGDVLVSRGDLDEDAVRRVKAYVLGIPFVNLKEHHLSIEVLSFIPEPISRTHNIVAYNKKGDSLEVAMLDIEDLASIEAMHKNTGIKILPRFTDTESIKYGLLRYQKVLKDEFGNIISTEAGKMRAASKNGKDFSINELKKMAEDLSVVRIVDTLLRHAIVQGASDIHIEPTVEEVLIRYRINGILHDAMTLPKAVEAGIYARIKVLSKMKVDEKHLPQDGRFKMETATDVISFRVSTIPTFFGEKIVMRLLRETGDGFTLESLGFNEKSIEKLHEALNQQAGIILISGPNDSGKTTTLYTMLDILNRPGVNISTIEDPIEYQMKRVNQSQVNKQIGFTFANGLRSLVKQDPDIIMVGDIRDGATAELAVSTAMSGRLVLASITADSPIEALKHIVAMGVDPSLLSELLCAVIGQKLIQKSDGDGRVGMHEVLSPEDMMSVLSSS